MQRGPDSGKIRAKLNTDNVVWRYLIASTVTLCLLLTAWSTCANHAAVDHAHRSLRLETHACLGSHIEVGASAHGTRKGDLRTDAVHWIDHAQEDILQHGLSVDEPCDSQLGKGFLQRFTDSATNLCTAIRDQSSLVECFRYPVSQQGVSCIARHLLLDSHSFLGQGPSAGAAAHEAYLPAGSPGSVRLDCDINTAIAKDEELQKSLRGEQLPWLKTALKQEAPAELNARCNDPSTSINHPVLFLSRLDTTNPYHHTQSVTQTFLTLAVLGATNMTMHVEGVQVVIADHFQEGPFMDIWRLLSYPYPVSNLTTISRKGEVKCFTKAILAHYATPTTALLGYEGVGHECACLSVLLIAVSHWLRYLLLYSMTMPQSAPVNRPAAIRHAKQLLNTPTGHQRLNVVYISRSWFERAMMAGGGLTPWQRQRVVSQADEDALTQALQQTVLQWNLHACVPPVFGWWQKPEARPTPQGCVQTNVTFDFRVAELALMELYPSQFSMFMKTAVLVAAHGAALTNQIFMRPMQGAVVEIWHNNYHYLNEAHMLGHKHFKSGPKPSEVASAVHQAMQHVSSKY